MGASACAHRARATAWGGDGGWAVTAADGAPRGGWRCRPSRGHARGRAFQLTSSQVLPLLSRFRCASQQQYAGHDLLRAGARRRGAQMRRHRAGACRVRCPPQACARSATDAPPRAQLPAQAPPRQLVRRGRDPQAFAPIGAPYARCHPLRRRHRRASSCLTHRAAIAPTAAAPAPEMATSSKDAVKARRSAPWRLRAHAQNHAACPAPTVTNNRLSI
jgi:hypothetical protein